MNDRVRAAPPDEVHVELDLDGLKGDRGADHFRSIHMISTMAAIAQKNSSEAYLT